jgi:ADP-ribosylglycohydrolase
MYSANPMPELVEQPSEQHSEALYSVVAGEGDGFMLGLVAGDTAGGAWDLGYSAVTEQATIIAYELITQRTLDHDRLVHGLLEMDGADQEDPVYRAESPEFRAWLDRSREGQAHPGPESSLDAAARVLPLGVVFRREPERVVSVSVGLGKLFHTDAATIASGVIAASAVAASCFAQSGLDLIAGVAETMKEAAETLASELDGGDRVTSLSDEVEALMPSVGLTSGDEALEAVGGQDDDPIRMILAGLLLAAPVVHRHHLPIEQAARVGGSRLGAVVGAIVGARVGIRAWPWAFANDTWFAEIGRRLVRGPREVRDLPIPYAVEQHLMSGGRPGFH